MIGVKYMIPIPEYLKDNAINPKYNKNNTQFHFVCDCNNKHFYILENHLNKEEKEVVNIYNKAVDKAFSGIWIYVIESDENGIEHYWRCYTPLGMQGPKKEIFFPDKPLFYDLNVVMAKCACCGKEYVLFDSRYHGYDGLVTDSPDALLYNPHFKQKGNSPLEVIIKVENEDSIEEFIETTGEECDETFYSNGFSSIVIYTKNDEGKKRVVFDAETA